MSDIWKGVAPCSTATVARLGSYPRPSAIFDVLGLRLVDDGMTVKLLRAPGASSPAAPWIDGTQPAGVV